MNKNLKNLDIVIFKRCFFSDPLFIEHFCLMGSINAYTSLLALFNNQLHLGLKYDKSNSKIETLTPSETSIYKEFDPSIVKMDKRVKKLQFFRSLHILFERSFDGLEVEFVDESINLRCGEDQIRNAISTCEFRIKENIHGAALMYSPEDDSNDIGESIQCPPRGDWIVSE